MGRNSTRNIDIDTLPQKMNIPLHSPNWRLGILQCNKNIHSNSNNSTEYVSTMIITVTNRERQYTYNVTVRRVHATIVVEKQEVLHVVSVCL